MVEVEVFSGVCGFKTVIKVEGKKVIRQHVR